MQRQIVKIFSINVSISLSPVLLSSIESFQQWMKLLIFLFELPLPKDQIPQDEAALKAHPLLKCKKWIGKIFNNLLLKYGNPKADPDTDDEEEVKQRKLVR
eukprot:g5582.t1